MKPATEILLSAAFVLTPEENFLQHAYARFSNGHRSWERGDADRQDAVQWCVVAAIDQAGIALGIADDIDDAQRAFRRFAKAQLHDLMATAEGFNNTRTHATVLSALYSAAELSEAS